MAETSDVRPEEVARDIRDCHVHLDTIIDRLCAASTESEIDRVTSDGVRGRGDPRGSDPTLGELEHLERWLTVRERRLVGWWDKTTDEDGEEHIRSEEPGVVHELLSLAADGVGAEVDGPVTPDGLTIDELVHAIRDTSPAARSWRLRIRQLGTALHGVIETVHDRWHELYRARWRDSSDGLTRFDEEADRHATFVAGWVRQVSGRRLDRDERPPGDNLRKLAASVEPPREHAQPELVYCDEHPDRLARNRRRRQCDACAKRSERQAKKAAPSTPHTVSAVVLHPGQSWT